MLPFREVKRAKVEIASVKENDVLKVFLVKGPPKCEASLLPREEVEDTGVEEDWTGREFLVVRSVKPESINPVYVLDKGKVVPLSAFKHIFPPEQASRLNSLRESFREGARLTPFRK